MDGKFDKCGLAMSAQLSTANAVSLEKELAWFSSVLDTRIALYFEHDATGDEEE